MEMGGKEEGWTFMGIQVFFAVCGAANEKRFRRWKGIFRSSGMHRSRARFCLTGVDGCCSTVFFFNQKVRNLKI